MARSGGRLAELEHEAVARPARTHPGPTSLKHNASMMHGHHHDKTILVSAITACIAFWAAIALALAEFLELIEF